MSEKLRNKKEVIGLHLQRKFLKSQVCGSYSFLEEHRPIKPHSFRLVRTSDGTSYSRRVSTATRHRRMHRVLRKLPRVQLRISLPFSSLPFPLSGRLTRLFDHVKVNVAWNESREGERVFPRETVNHGA